MSRINTNVTSLIAQRVLRQNNTALSTSMQRLSTGLRINSGADDPAGLIASQNLRAEKTGLTSAINNAQRATNIIGTAEGGLSEVSNLLNQLQGLVTSTANTGGLSDEEIAANQLQVDSILSTINRISDSTQFEGKKLLNGEYAYTTGSLTNVTDVQVNAARMPDGVTSQAVTVDVTTAATQAIVDGGKDALTDNVTIDVAGNLGTEQLSFASGTSLASIKSAVNAVTTATGVSAVTSTDNHLYFKSTQYGADQFVNVTQKAGTIGHGNDTGSDAVVNVNGSAASVKGTTVSFRNNNLDVEFSLDATSNVDGGTASFAITGGGANFALGSKVSEGNKASIGIASVSASDLGDSINGYLSDLSSGGTNSLSSNNLVSAQRSIDKAIKQVSQLRGRLGAFQQFTLGSTINSLNVSFENASAADSAIADTDFANETANMTRSQILSQAATTVLTQANASPQSVLTLLRGG
jgi:flagellin